MQRFSLYGVHKRDYLESVTTGQTDARTHRQTPDKVFPMCRYASQATQKHASPKVGQDQVSGGVSVLCWHAAPVEYVLWKPCTIR